MQLIDQQPHFWELYQQQDNYYLGFAVDTGDAMHCWHLKLSSEQSENYQQQGRTFLEDWTKQLTQAIYTANFTVLKAQQVDPNLETKMRQAYKEWYQTVAKT